MLDQKIRQPKTTWRGERVRTAKLTERDVQVIRELWALGVTVSELASVYPVSGVTIINILHRKKWAHVPATDTERTALGCQVETQAPPMATTGRLQHWHGTGWTTYENIRQAEIGSGQDRLEIAAACLSGGLGWRYEPGLATDAEPDLW